MQGDAEQVWIASSRLLLAMTISSLNVVPANAVTTRDTVPRSRGAMRPSCAINHSPQTEGVGNAGCPPHPQPRVQNKKHTS
jgi:hypothetical protein